MRLSRENRRRLQFGASGAALNQIWTQEGLLVVANQMLLLLGALCLFFFKHFLFDFTFQTKYQLKNKGTYGHPGGLLHAGLHAFGSIPALLVLGPTVMALLGLCAAEFIAHYHIDWLKERIVKKHGWTSSDYGFWQALGVDQLMHALSYLAMATALIVLQSG